MEPEVLNYDIVIVGAGPAGCACALALKDSGLKVALLDKSEFPRDKVCGDAIPGRVVKTLKSISPGLAEAFRNFPKKNLTTKSLISFKGQALDFDWTLEAYTCARMDFDNFLFTLVKQFAKADIYTNTSYASLQQDKDGITINDKSGKTLFHTKLIIGADGAHSLVAKQLTNRTVDKDHYVGSVRAYFTNVGNTENCKTEVYFDKRFLPSYLWVFPLPGNRANVGFGMLSSEISRRKINIKKTFYEFINENPELKSKFRHAVQEGDLEGFGLPLGSKRVPISGERFMLTGDAASLIDPISGDGIGNAMLSGKLAADQAIKCLQASDFSAAYMKQYDDSLFKVIGDELKKRFRAQQILAKMPFLLDIIFLAGRNKTLKRLINRNL